MKKVSVIGLGYVGLPTAAVIANNGYRVYAYDVNPNIIQKVNNCSAHFSEPDLNELIAASVQNGCLSAHSQLMKADYFLICVPTPIIKNTSGEFEPDISYVVSASLEIAKVVQPGNCVILESTSPIGTTEKIKQIIEKESGVTDVSFAYSPERIIPGNTIFELQNNSRVIGGVSPEDTKIASLLYKDYVKGELSLTNSKTAEMCKLSENAFRDVNIAFANELSMVCDVEGIDTSELISIANLHPRVNILRPGIGVGGHCIAVDPWFLISQYKDHTSTMASARRANVQKTAFVVNKIIGLVDKFEVDFGYLPKIALYGLAYKPDIDDLRESPALEIANQLKARSLHVSCVEPNISSYNGLDLKNATQVKEYDLHIELVKHHEFSEIFTFERLENTYHTFVV